MPRPHWTRLRRHNPRSKRRYRPTQPNRVTIRKTSRASGCCGSFPITGRSARERVEDLINLFGGVRQAWGQIEKQAPAGPSQASVFSRARDAERTHTVAIKSEEIDAPQLHWSV